jgi:ketosteroid isomerase-like protein
MATTDDNKQLVREYFRAFLQKDEAWWRAHIAPSFVRHDPGLPFEVRGPEGVIPIRLKADTCPRPGAD